MRQVALITGGARRVGAAIVRRLAEAGWDVAFTYRTSRAEAEALVKDLSGGGRQVLAIPADLTTPDGPAHAAAQVLEGFGGRLDLLVNNASIYPESSLQNVEADVMRALWALHIEAPLLLCRRLEQPLRQSRGHVVNMADLLAERPWPKHLAYCASKAALVNLTIGLARELAPEVTVNAIAPGVVAWADHQGEEEREKYLKRVPLGRIGSPQDVAELVLFLATTGRYITGQVIRLDGGRSVT